MNRRGFFGRLLSGLAIAKLAPAQVRVGDIYDIKGSYVINPKHRSYFPSKIYGFNVNDTFTIEGVNKVNPLNFQDTGLRMVFVCIKESGEFWPNIITSGQYTNCVVKDEASLKVEEYTPIKIGETLNIRKPVIFKQQYIDPTQVRVR